MLSYVQGVKVFVVEESISSHCQLLAYINNHKQSFHNTSQYITMHHSRSKPALHGRIDSQPRSSQTRASFIFYRNLGKECEDGFQLRGSCTNKIKTCRMRPTALDESMHQENQEQESSKCHAWNEYLMNGQEGLQRIVPDTLQRFTTKLRHRVLLALPIANKK